jgi:hypothetical protein
MHSHGSATSCEFVRVRLHRLSAIPALLVCYAVVFNLGPFAKVPQGGTVAEMSRRPFVAEPIAGPEAASDTLADSPLATADATGRSKAAEAAIGDLAQVVSQSMNLRENGQLPIIPISDTATPNASTQQPTFEGIWAPNASSCSLRDLRDGSLATIIDMEGARAGDTYCVFKKQERMATGWRVVANCSSSLEHWATEVRLTVKGDHLTWVSRRGRQIYTRCAPDAVMAAVR